MLRYQYNNVINCIVIGILLYLVFLLKLSSYPIRIWDESWYAVNAYEMIQNHQYFVPHFNGSIDHVYTKPLLSLWFQVLSIKLLGYNELAVRLPSAIAAAFSSLVIFFFLKKLGKTNWAWCSFLVLITSFGFVNFHTARTGDTDSIMNLFSLLSNIFFFYYIESEQYKNRNIYLYFLFLGFALGVKSIAPLLFVPANLFMLFFKKQWQDFFSRKGTYLGIMTFLTLAMFFIMSRQVKDPAYISNVIKYDVLRLSTIVDGHNEPFDFYFNNFLNSRFSLWCSVFVFSIVLLFLQRKESTVNAISVWAISLFTSLFFMISVSNTKLYWYDMPLYPYMAIITGYSISYFFENIGLFKVKTAYEPFIYLMLFCVPIYYAIKHSHDNSGMSSGEKKAERISEYLYTRGNEGVNLNKYAVVSNQFISPLLFYKYKLLEKGQELAILDTDNIVPLSKVIVKDSAVKRYIQNKFNYTIADTFHEVIVFNIETRK